ncbi:hypothetical protein PR048_030176 [Dryococelus australis]|uniref:Uncharacterized protein n=1 Tax=Dryococelus australis TaxID=614101 RepID=A0ABQ9G8Z5_9NEOP|nr:hypothetical protein PR048_030176 [Dryococelus australis]
MSSRYRILHSVIHIKPENKRYVTQKTRELTKLRANGEWRTDWAAFYRLQNPALAQKKNTFYSSISNIAME